MTSTARLAFLGTGLVGTSIAMAARRNGDAVRGWDPDRATLDVAAAHSGLEPCAGVADAVLGASIAFVCTPTGRIPDVATAALAAAGDVVVTDVGSVKAPVVEAVRRSADAAAVARFVGGHPMGGSERSGPEGASPSVVDGIVWALTPAPETSEASLRRLEAWIRSVGSRPVRLDPLRHDRLVAIVSHLPQIASTVLMGLAAGEDADEPDLLLLAAGGFRDLTRLASSSPALWSDILVSNSEAIGEAVDRYIDRLARLRDLVRARDGAAIENAFARSKRARLRLAAKPQIRSGVAVLQVPVPDRPGALAQLTASLGASDVNIEDLQIVHAPEGGRGTVHLTVAAAAVDEATRALTAGRFEPARIA
jgi:prephenate dehydrogenase